MLQNYLSPFTIFMFLTMVKRLLIGCGGVGFTAMLFYFSFSTRDEVRIYEVDVCYCYRPGVWANFYSRRSIFCINLLFSPVSLPNSLIRSAIYYSNSFIAVSCSPYSLSTSMSCYSFISFSFSKFWSRCDCNSFYYLTRLTSDSSARALSMSLSFSFFQISSSCEILIDSITVSRCSRSSRCLSIICRFSSIRASIYCRLYSNSRHASTLSLASCSFSYESCSLQRLY